jgi:hypothetical protein
LIYSLYKNEYRNLKPTETTIRKGEGRMKKIRGDKPVGVIIHIYKEISQENSLCSYLYLKQTKCHVFSFYLFIFSFTKSENKRAELVLPAGTHRRGRCWEKGIGGRIWRKKRVHTYINGK